MSAIACTRCAREVPASDVNLAQAIARCTACNIVFACGQAGAGAYSKPEVPLPPRFEAEQGPEGFTITRRWHGPMAYALLLFTLFWNAIVGFFFAINFAVAFLGGGGISLFPLIHASAGVFLIYLTAAMFLNRTVIRVNARELSITHGPLPWRGNKTLESRQVAQLFCEEQESSRRSNSRVTTYTYTYSYRVQVRMKDSTTVELVRGLETPDQALFIEQRLERHLGLPDRRMSGEIRPL